MPRKNWWSVCIVATVFLVLGCSNGEQEASNGDSAIGSAAPLQGESNKEIPVASVESLRGTASLRGVVRFKGELPRSAKIHVSGDSYCVEVHGESFVESDVMVDAAGRVQNVFVYIKSGLPNRRFVVPETSVVIDQSGCMYDPRVVGVQVGQKLQFRNSDKTLHNVHAIADRKLGNKGFNFGMPGRRNITIERVFKAPEVMVRIKCDVHPWMVSWVGVVSHPWYVVTDAQGRFAFEQLPAGDYEIDAWHERLGTVTATVHVEPGASEVLEIFLKFSDAPRE